MYQIAGHTGGMQGSLFVFPFGISLWRKVCPWVKGRCMSLLYTWLLDVQMMFQEKKLCHFDSCFDETRVSGCPPSLPFLMQQNESSAAFRKSRCGADKHYKPGGPEKFSS